MSARAEENGRRALFVLKRIGQRTALCLIAAVYCAFPALAAEPASPASGGVNMGARIGNDAGEGFVDVIIPFHSDSDSIVFLNPRASLKDEGETELNLGLVVRRQIPDSEVILGANAYIDRRESRNGNTFNQTGLGLEFLSRRVDARLNYYHPNDDRVMIADAQVTDVDVDVSTSTSTSMSRRSTTELDTSLLGASTSGGQARFEGNNILTGGAVTERTFRATATTTTRTTTTITRTTTTTTTDRFCFAGEIFQRHDFSNRLSSGPGSIWRPAIRQQRSTAYSRQR